MKVRREVYDTVGQMTLALSMFTMLRAWSWWAFVTWLLCLVTGICLAVSA